MNALQFIPTTILCGTLFIGCGEKVEDRISYLASSDTEMNAAIDKAKLSLDRFTEAYSQRASKPAEFFLKKPYPTPEGGDEHVWITVTGTNSHGFAGIVNNDVEHSKKVRLGDTVVVHPREVSDWFFVRDHVVHGAYTIRVLLRHETATERAEAIAHLGGTLAPENE